MTPIVIGISGKIGAGKDEVAKRLAVAHGFKIIRFSDQLKEEVLRTLRLTCEEIWREYYDHRPLPAARARRHDAPTEADLRAMLWETKPLIVRRLLQEWGTELRRHEDPEYWVDKWLHTTQQALAQGFNVAVPDARFMNELRAVDLLDGHNVLVTRPGTKEGDHSSEHEWASYAGWRWTFYNDGTIQDLQSKVDEFLSHLR